MTIEGITSLRDPRSLEEADRYIEDIFYKNRYTDQNSYTGDSTAAISINTTTIVNHINNILREAQYNSKGLRFILSRTALHALNPQLGMGQIYNPLAFIGLPPPAGGLMVNSIDVFDSSQNPGTRIARQEDRLRDYYDGSYTKLRVKGGIPPVEIQGPDTRMSDGTTFEDKMKELNIVGPNESFGKTLPFEKQEFFAAANPNLKIDQVGGVEITKPDYDKIFSRLKDGPGFTNFGKGYEFFKPDPNSRRPTSAEYTRKEKAIQNDDTYFSYNDTFDGYINEFLEKIHDDDTYIPLYFSDFRAPERRIYFRAFLNNLVENFAPEWNKEKFYGRVDPVSTYMGTERTITLDFSIIAMSNVGLSTMWKKINNFIKLMYPTYSNKGVLRAAPLGRLRVGDVIADGNGRGLPGYIVSANLNYNESPWEIDSYQHFADFEIGKVPMICKMSITWQVIHEENPHLDEDYNLNTNYIRRMGRLPPQSQPIEGNNDSGGISIGEITVVGRPGEPEND